MRQEERKEKEGELLQEEPHGGAEENLSLENPHGGKEKTLSLSLGCCSNLPWFRKMKYRRSTWTRRPHSKADYISLEPVKDQCSGGMFLSSPPTWPLNISLSLVKVYFQVECFLEGA